MAGGPRLGRHAPPRPATPRHSGDWPPPHHLLPQSRSTATANKPSTNFTSAPSSFLGHGLQGSLVYKLTCFHERAQLRLKKSLHTTAAKKLQCKCDTTEHERCLFSANRTSKRRNWIRAALAQQLLLASSWDFGGLCPSSVLGGGGVLREGRGRPGGGEGGAPILK